MEERSKISILKALHCSWVDFMTHTSMHGVRYICEDGRKIVEKIFWIIIVTSGIVSTALMVRGIYKRYTSHSTMSVIKHTHYPTWVFPFPGVTVCNNNRIFKSKAEKLVQKLTLPKDVTVTEVVEDFKLLGALQNPDFVAEERFKRLQDILDDNRYNINDLMSKLGQTCEEMFEKCSWENKIVNCSDVFKFRKSHHGFCCSFNHLGVMDSRSKKHSTLLYKVEGKPRRTLLYGPNFGLSVLVNPLVHDYFLADYSATGITVIIHHPEDYPDETSTERMIKVGKEVLMPITISALYCTKDVKKLSIPVRRCVFPDEHPLRFFPEYRYRSCIAECIMNRTIDFCGCLPYYYPDNGIYQPCDLTNVKCLYNHFEMLHSRKPPTPEKSVFDKTEEEEMYRWNQMENSTECDCPKPCDIIVYHADVNVGDLEGKYTVDPFLNAGVNTTNRILLHVFMESDFGKLINRDIVNSLSDLLSNLGGVVCLFLGCSFVTLVEILYFFTIRLKLRKQKRIQKKREHSCPLTPRDIKDARYLSAKKQTFRTIRVLPQKIMTISNSEVK